MTEKEFLNAVANGKTDVLQVFLDTVSQLGADYCVVGGLAVSAYAEPVTGSSSIPRAGKKAREIKSYSG